MTPTKENNCLGTSSKEMEICDLLDTEFRIVVLREVIKVLENIQS